MNKKEIINEIKSYCEKGLLKGLIFDVPYGSPTNILRAMNIHIKHNDVIFDQYSMRCECFTFRNDYLCEHDSVYLNSLIMEIRKAVKIDRNLFA